MLKWLQSPAAKGDLHKSPEVILKVRELSLQGCVERSSFLSFVFAGMFGGYGFTSLAFLQKFDPSITLWSNVWPRLLFNSLPLVALGYWIRNSKTSDSRKFNVWIWTFSMILH